MNFRFQSSDIKQLTDIAQEFQAYVNHNKEVTSRDIFMEELVNSTIKKYRKLPENIGTVYTCNSLDHPICKICGKSIKLKQQVRKLNCNHKFHKKCIDNWLIDNDLRCIQCNTFGIKNN